MATGAGDATAGLQAPRKKTSTRLILDKILRFSFRISVGTGNSLEFIQALLFKGYNVNSKIIVPKRKDLQKCSGGRFELGSILTQLWQRLQIGPDRFQFIILKETI